MVAYRTPNEPDAELLCATILHRRAERVRKLVLVPMRLAAFPIGAALYTLVRELFLWRKRAHMPYLTGALSFAPAFVGALRGARRLGDRVARARVESRTSEVAFAHGVSPEILEDHLRLVRGDE